MFEFIAISKRLVINNTKNTRSRFKTFHKNFFLNLDIFDLEQNDFF